MKKLLTSKLFLAPIILILTVVVIVNYQLSYKGTVEYVKIKANDIEIEGALVRPKTAGPHPGIILLQGAGSSHQGYDKWYNRFHTNELVNRGFAVLSYTKRGSGNNKVDYMKVTYHDLANDAISCFNFLKTQANIDPQNIGLMGISESGWFTPEIASRVGEIKFIINRVSPPVSWRETVIHEVKMDAEEFGFSKKEIDEVIVPLTLNIWQYYIDANKENSPLPERRNSINKELKELHSRERFKDWFEEKLEEYDPEIYAVRARKFSYDPQPFLKEMDVPMLYIMAGKDVNVPTQLSIEVLNMFKQEYGKEITIKLYPNAGHYLYKWKFLPIEGLYEDGYLELVGSWAEEQVNQN